MEARSCTLDAGFATDTVRVLALLGGLYQTDLGNCYVLSPRHADELRWSIKCRN